MDSGTNSVGESVGESPAPEPATRPVEKVTKGRGLRRWRRIPREQQHEWSPASTGAAGAGAGVVAGEDLAAQLHKRRLGPAADAPKGKQDAAAEESSITSVESSFVPPEASPPPAPTGLDPNLGLLIATAGFSVGAGGADSDNSDDRASKSSTAASAPRHDFSFGGFGRERDRARFRAPGGAAHCKNIRTARVRGASARAAAAAAAASPVEVENSLSSVESNLLSSSAAHARRSSAGITSNGVHKVLFPDDHHSDEEPPSEEVRYTTGGFYKENGSVVGRLVMGNCDSDANNHIFDEAGVGKFENGGIHSGLDPYAESIVLLQSAQEALENEIQKFVEIREETDESSTIHHSETEWSSSPHPDEPVEELSEKLKFLESKLEEATLLINKKDSRILELDARNPTQQRETVTCNSNVLSLQSDIEQLLLEKMEAEIQCFILTRVWQAWEPLTKDNVALYEAQISEASEHKHLETKLRHTENRAMMLEEMVDKLEAQCKELSETSEVLKLQAKASRASLFCSIQLVMLCIAMGTLLVRFLPSFPELVPT
ncbi:WPP domain-interacting protein 2-like [Phragmites australis]|uniref:WPP domain-interacting protein 2-like n=1 Tax=Phragmites australis TaxID=29695 RepID=UPI002D77D2C6|nr:WPP domain-interacting protein 2-like [Phragmites australis]